MKNIYLLNELAAKTGVSEIIILEWEKEKLIKPSGETEEKTPFYNEDAIAQCEHIMKLTELGYSLQEIGKIIKKVGLPANQPKENDPVTGKLLTVGELADKINVSPRTIKHWEDKGIIEPDMRSEGGFRLYADVYVYLCSLILDLQNFGYTLDEIKIVSDHFRDYLALQTQFSNFEKSAVSAKIDVMNSDIEKLLSKMNMLKEGINRWEELLKKKKKELQNMMNINNKRLQ
ncbi:MAG: MerR family transcriptional regulator [Ignavibacteriaceae bacterium]|nr:MerR family transcriptional regulator [Ignavibacteriaceae bacterium]